MTEEERLELIEGTDEDGNRLLLTVEKYFFYNGDEYVLLKAFEEAVADAGGQEAAGASQDAAPVKSDPDDPKPGLQTETLYVMKVSVSKGEDGEEIEDFEPVDEDLAQRLIPVIKSRFATPDLGETLD